MTNAAAQTPPEIIETERLLLRVPVPGDGAEVNAAIRETFEDLHVWMDWARNVPSVEESEEYARRAREDFDAGRDFSYSGFLKGSERLALKIGFHPKDWAVPRFEIGYWCRASFQGRGYVTEAVKALTRVGFELVKANRIEIRCDPRNVRSRRVAERAGYKLEATLRNEQRRPDDQLRDTLVYALLPHEYDRDYH